jgi:hypothetical protein
MLTSLVPVPRLLQDCQGMQSCFQVCQQKCPTAPPPGPTVNGQLCESYGALASGTEAQKACDLTMVSRAAQTHQRTSIAPATTHGTGHHTDLSTMATFDCTNRRPQFPVVTSTGLARRHTLWHMLTAPGHQWPMHPMTDDTLDIQSRTCAQPVLNVSCQPGAVHHTATSLR